MREEDEKVECEREVGKRMGKRGGKVGWERGMSWESRMMKKKKKKKTSIYTLVPLPRKSNFCCL